MKANGVSVMDNHRHVFERTGTAAENWQARMEKLRINRRFGRFYATSRARLQEVAQHPGLSRAANLAGCPVR
jgi:hypothetical protein